MTVATGSHPAEMPVTSKLDTIPKLLLRNAERYGAKPAFREKEFGIWQTWTWSQARDEIRALALGLKKLGLKRGATVAIIGDNRPHLYWAFTAAQSLGAIPVPVYQDSVADEMAFVLTHAEVSFAVVEDQEQVDKLISIRTRCRRSPRSYTTISTACRSTIQPTCIRWKACRSWAATS